MAEVVALPHSAAGWVVRMRDGAHPSYEFHAASAEARDTWVRAVAMKISENAATPAQSADQAAGAAAALAR